MSLINLLPQDYYERRHGRRTNAICVVLFVVVMVCIVSASMVSRSNANETRGVMDNLNRSYSQAAQTISQMQTLRGQKQTILDKRRRIEALQDPVPKSIVLAILTNARPDGVSLLNIKLDSRFDPPKAPNKALTINTTKGQSAAPPKPERNPEPSVTVEIIGLARTDFQVARYLANLTDSGLTDSVDLSYTQDYTPGGGGDRPVPENLQNLREFRLKCRLSKKIDAKGMAKQWRFTKQEILSSNTRDSVNNSDADKPTGNAPGILK
ncbi:MAG: PilN domain-containing protein [Phycisphaerae bacterium]|jgi:Tfp pilus assembly protein PilN|nr:PilN domain-containing protein [Phycisphaerae bacterium]